jgi:hypothetical protein
MESSQQAPSRRSQPRPRFGTVLGFAYLLAVVAATAVRPEVGLALASLGTIYLLFRLIALDATAIVTFYLLFLMLLPAGYVVPSVGAAGTPANAVALGCAYWWFLQRTTPATARLRAPEVARVSPMRVALLVLLLTSAISFVAAFARPLTSVESNGAARAFLALVGMTGVALLVSDGAVSIDRLKTLLNRLLNLASLMSVVACLQFFTSFDPVARWTVPGLELNQELASVTERSVVNRVASTTLHPIEFGAVVAILLPLAIHTALYAEKHLRFRRWLRVGLLGLALPLSVSRTAVVIVLVAFLMILPAWDWGRRLRFIAGAVVFLLVVRSVVSGLLGTIVALFTNLFNDPSTSGRTDDYSIVWDYFGERPLLGRGLGTFDPTLYIYLDNQVLMTLITGGLVAVGGLLLLAVVAASVSRQVYWHGSSEESRHLGAALAASIVGGFVGFFTFDALGFPVFAGTMFVIMGMGGALWRLDVAPFGRRYTNPRKRPRAQPRAVTEQDQQEDIAS